MRTGTTLIVAAIALAAGGFAGYRLALPKPEAVAQSVAPQGDLSPRPRCLRGAVDIDWSNDFAARFAAAMNEDFCFYWRSEPCP